LQQVTCAGNATTSVTGTVYAPNGLDPLPNAVVYVPNAAVAPFTPSVSCDNCAQASGSPVVGGTTAVDGKFTLTNVPAGNNIPLVIQIGRWRRQVTIPTVTACATTALPAALTRLPKNKTEGDIPKQAFVTGEKDALECVLRKIGVDDAEFTNAVGSGRIHLYAAADPGESTVATANNFPVNHGARQGGVGPAASSAITPTGTTEWDYRLLDTHSWLMADAMNYSRAYHAAVLLADGRVLVAGGLGALGTTAAATTTALKQVEIYDPTTNAWTLKASMGTARIAPTATLLQNGKVLVTGGYSGSTYYATAELYNPATDTWSSAGTMTGVVRARHTATLLDNGKVLVVGGTNGTTSNSTASLYNPATNTWSATLGAPTTGRFYHTATLLSNGKVLIAGGVNSGTASLNSAELYNPLLDTFAATPNMPAVRQQHSDTRLAAGQVLLTGGVGSGSTVIGTTAIYDATANTWSTGAAMASPRKGHEAALLTDGTVVVFGGVDGSGTYLTTEETYNPAPSNTWSVVAHDYNDGHAYHTATTLQNGRVLMVGGYTSGGGLLGYSEILIQRPINQYDIVLFPCPGNAYYYSAASEQRYQNNLANYANIGGRVFTTHFTYSWIYNDNSKYFSPLSPALGWGINQTNPTPDPQTGFIDQTFPKGDLLAKWLKAIGASTTLGQISINTLRHDFNSATAPTQNWMSVNQPASTKMHVTFNTPLAASASNQCGRVVFSDFHVEDRSSDVTKDKEYPTECDASLAMTPQEKLLEFMMFDLASCITPDTIPACVPKTCAELGLNCGTVGNGCGGTVSCGTCPTGQVCGWGSTPNVCAVPLACVPTTCAAQGLSCGPAGNGCGGSLNCGTCPSPQVCGGGGPGMCGTLTSACVPTTCTALGLSCGPAGDGCGNALNCGSCAAPQTCGGGGQRGKCGSPPACVPTTCAALGLSCGPAGDGCGGNLDCGSCSAPDSCGGGGQPGICGRKYTTGSFVRDYPSSCPNGTSPVWSLWSWNATTPSDSHIDFSVQTATTLAGLSSAPSDGLLFSSPPGPAALVGQTASAHAANQPPGTPNTEIGAADVNNTFVVNNRPLRNAYVRITSSLVPSSDQTQTARLASWNLQMDCVPSQ
jgi:N-acetylneuraminic acid mutarotase